MFYFLSKTFDVLIMPLSLVIVALLYALFTKNSTRKKRTIFIAICFLYVVSNSIVVNKLLIWWEAPVPKQVMPHEVGVVLTGGMTHAYNPHTMHVWFGDVPDRMGQAFQLYKEGKIKKILISGGVSRLIKYRKEELGEAELVKHYLMLSGVPESDIVLENQAVNTRENAKFSAAILKNQFHTSRCILITSASHLPRAVGCFKKVGITPLPYPAQFNQRKLALWFDQIFPSEEALHRFYEVWHEIVGYTVYKAVGYI